MKSYNSVAMHSLLAIPIACLLFHQWTHFLQAAFAPHIVGTVLLDDPGETLESLSRQQTMMTEAYFFSPNAWSLYVETLLALAAIFLPLERSIRRTHTCGDGAAVESNSG